MSDDHYIAIETRFGIKVPPEYRLLAARGLLSCPKPGHASQFQFTGTYLWLHEMEWMTPEQIANFRFEDYQLQQFVPFAFTGGGDYWCWHSDPSAGTPSVWLCYHDDDFASYYAPDFKTALYRQVLDFCRNSGTYEDLNPQAFLRRWIADFGEVFPTSWLGRLEAFANGPFDRSAVEKIEQADIPELLTARKVRWTKH